MAHLASKVFMPLVLLCSDFLSVIIPIRVRMPQEAYHIQHPQGRNVNHMVHAGSLALSQIPYTIIPCELPCSGTFRGAIFSSLSLNPKSSSRSLFGVSQLDPGVLGSHSAENRRTCS